MKGAGVRDDGIPYPELQAEIVNVFARDERGPALSITSSPAGAHVAAEEAQGASTEGVVDVRLDLVLQEGWGVVSQF